MDLGARYFLTLFLTARPNGMGRQDGEASLMQKLSVQKSQFGLNHARERAMRTVRTAILALTLLSITAANASAQTDDQLRDIFNRRDVEQMERLARDGDVRAEAWMGLLYQNSGRRVEAKEWWRRAALKNNQWAISILAEMHRQDGENDEAMRWYRRAAEIGGAQDQARLAGLYREGKIVARDASEAIRLYRAAVTQREIHSYVPLAEMLTDGMSADRDPVEALALAELAEFYLSDVSDVIEFERAKELGAQLRQELDREGIERAERRTHELRPDYADSIRRREWTMAVIGAIVLAITAFILLFIVAAAYILFSVIRDFWIVLSRYNSNTVR